MRSARRLSRPPARLVAPPLHGLIALVVLLVFTAGMYAIPRLIAHNDQVALSAITPMTATTPEECAVVRTAIRRLAEDERLWNDGLPPEHSRAASPHIYINRDTIRCSLDLPGTPHLSVTFQWYNSQMDARLDELGLSDFYEASRQRSQGIAPLLYLSQPYWEFDEASPALSMDSTGTHATVHFGLWSLPGDCAYYTVELESRNGTWEVTEARNVGLIC